MPSAKDHRLRELAVLFLKLGLTTFGGPAAHISMMENEVVRRRQWLTHAEYLDLIGMVNLLPGPNSTELAIFIGHRRAGWRGLILGGVCFILPAALIVTALAWAYVRFGKLPAVAGVFHGIKPVIIAVVVQALWKLGPVALKHQWLALVGVVAVTLNLLGVNPLVVLLGSGLVMAAYQARGRLQALVLPLHPLAGAGLPLAAVAGVVSPFKLGSLFLFFLKVGSVLFGSGYLLLAFLRTDLVGHWHWLTENQLLDAVAVGQFTPGPVFTTATFIGFILGGPQAALVATVGIFLPAFLLVAVSGPLIPRLRASRVMGAFLDGVNVASLALMGMVTWQLGRAALVDVLTVLMALVAGILLLRYKINSAWLVLAGGFIGWLLSLNNN
jgi:chromate transporter